MKSGLLAAAELGGARVVEVTPAAFATLTGQRPDGLLAVVERPPTMLDRLELPAHPLIVVAAGTERPGNLGAIARTACAVGADAFLVADAQTDVFHRDVVRGSTGAIFRLRCATAPAERAIAWLSRREIRVLATSPSAETPYWKVSYDGAVAVVVGNERHGLPSCWLDAAAELIAIPMPGPVDSLNVAVAAGVVLCETTRTRHAPTPCRETATT